MHPAPTKSRSEFPSTFVLGRFLTSIPRSAYSASRKTLRYPDHPGCLRVFQRTCHVSERLDVERSYHVFERLTSATTNSITGTSISTPTTVASVAPD